MKKLFLICFVFLSVVCNGQEMAKLENLEVPGNGARFVEFTPDGRVIIGASATQITGWYTGSNSKKFEFNPDLAEITAMAVSSDNQYVVTGGGKGNVSIFNLETNENTGFKAHSSEIFDLDVSPDGKFIATASKDKTIKIWDFESHDLIKDIKGHMNYILSLSFNKKNQLLYGGSDQTVYLWDVSTGDHLIKSKIHGNWIRSVAFHPDGETFVTGSDDSKVLLSKWVNGKLESKSLEGQSGRIQSLAFSADGKYVAAGSGNSRIVVWNTSTGKEITRTGFINVSVNDIAFDATGKYFAAVVSPGSGIRLFDTRNLGIEQVVQFKDESDKTPPQIYLSNPPNIINDRVRYSGGILDIKGVIIDDVGVRQLKINGIETPFGENGNFIIKLPLTMGENYVSIEATDVNDNIALKKFIIERKNLDGENYDPVKAKNYALIIGVDQYEHWPHLQNAVRDANDIAGILVSKYEFDFSNVKMLTNDQATRTNIYGELRSYIEKITPQDNLLIYFSGHGHFDELLNEGYWIPYEAKTKSEGDYLANSSILKILQNINSQHTFLVADACFSGSLFADQRRGFTDNVESYKSRWGLASGRLETVSDGAYGKNSPFADAFIKFLKDNKKDKVAVSELVQYVKMTVSETTNQTPIGNPLKSLGDEGGEFIFYKKK